YHISNSLFPIPNPPFFGPRLRNTIINLPYFPHPHTHFIFPIISQQIPLIPPLILLILHYFILYPPFQLPNKTQSYFYKLLSLPIPTYIASQTFLNIRPISPTIPLTPL
ncbi:FtsW/RodA/SpoVE family cell cycle protein, partial [Staphylococcus epidermidis]|uniref:FtsW/RodA/SpoVE family cell cycle protein n=1 Tax=Staphylococcus epidermidis TaxID=1282 RepID=UPI001642EB60